MLWDWIFVVMILVVELMDFVMEVWGLDVLLLKLCFSEC